jgi:hypothetical protein
MVAMGKSNHPVQQVKKEATTHFINRPEASLWCNFAKKCGFQLISAMLSTIFVLAVD